MLPDTKRVKLSVAKHYKCQVTLLPDTISVKLPVLPDITRVKLPVLLDNKREATCVSGQYKVKLGGWTECYTVLPDNNRVKLPVLPGKILDLAGLWSASLLEEATSMESVTL